MDAAPEASADADASDEVDPGGDAPDCRATGQVAPLEKSTRWLAFRGNRFGESTISAYLVRVTADGVDPPRRLSTVFSTWGVGAWSADGRFFAYAGGETTPQGIHLAEVGASGEPAQNLLSDTATFFWWSPVGTRLALRAAQNTLRIHDAAQLGQPYRAVGLGRIVRYFGTWSPDGRYFIVRANGDDVGLYVVDTAAAQLELKAITTQPATNLAWSPDGSRMAYARYAGNEWHLYLVEMTSAGFAELRIGGVLNGGVFSWIDDRWMGWLETGSNALHLADVTISPFAPAMIESLVGDWSFSPGGKCVAYRGVCGAKKEEGVCVRSLPPDPARPAILVAHYGSNRIWSRDASWLAVTPYGGMGLWAVPTVGGPFRRTFVPSGTSVGNVDEFAQWSPTQPPQWLAYTAAPPGVLATTTRLWNVANGSTMEIETPGLQQQFGDFSPDGLYYALSARDPGYPPLKVPLLIQKVSATALETRSEVPGVLLPLIGFAADHLAWQP